MMKAAIQAIAAPTVSRAIEEAPPELAARRIDQANRGAAQCRARGRAQMASHARNPLPLPATRGGLGDRLARMWRRRLDGRSH